MCVGDFVSSAGGAQSWHLGRPHYRRDNAMLYSYGKGKSRAKAGVRCKVSGVGRSEQWRVARGQGIMNSEGGMMNGERRAPAPD